MKCKFPGYIINNNLSDDDGIARQKSFLYAQANVLARKGEARRGGAGRGGAGRGGAGRGGAGRGGAGRGGAGRGGAGRGGAGRGGAGRGGAGGAGRGGAGRGGARRILSEVYSICTRFGKHVMRSTNMNTTFNFLGNTPIFCITFLMHLKIKMKLRQLGYQQWNRFHLNSWLKIMYILLGVSFYIRVLYWFTSVDIDNM